MTSEIPTNSPEKKEILDDNARKFLVTDFDSQLLLENDAVSYDLSADWLAIGADNETKLAYKKFDNGDIKILLISKVTENGNRTSNKKPIDETKYKELLASSLLKVEKRRHEFKYKQGDIPFSLNYDEYGDGKPTVLEVDASSEEERTSFDPNNFPATLKEVTGDVRYYGYHIADII